MNDAKNTVCPQCGAPLPADAPAGLCPRCLMAVNLAEPTAFTGDDGASAETAKTVPSPEEIAQHFPNFDILECLGRGGMGVVYKARQKSLNRLVALKILAPEREKDEAFARRFAVEAETLAKLNHPGIVTIFDFGRSGGLFYLVMEFVDGVTLRQLLKTGRVAPREALAVVPQICDALQFAHDHGIIHRDIKPENILLDRRGRVKVADFGLAKLIGPETPPAGPPSPGADAAAPGAETAALTDAGKVMGTPQYMAPEQKDNPSEVDHRADIYALGVVFYQLLTGELPGQTIEPPSRKVQIDVRLDEIVLRALEKAPGRRYSQASALKTQLETLAESPASAPSGAPLPAKDQRYPVTAMVAWAMVPLLLFRRPVVDLVAVAITVLGWSAVSSIRRSEGRLRGLRTAFFLGMAFPLFALNTNLVAVSARYVLRPDAPFRFFFGGRFSALPAGMVTAALCFLADWLVIRVAWRAIKRPPRGAAIRWPAALRWSRKNGLRAGAVILAVILGLLLIRHRLVQSSRERAARDYVEATEVNSAPARTFVGHYSSGTVELIALAKFPATNSPQWRPDGGPFAGEFPFEPGTIWNPGEQKEMAREVAFRITDTSGTISPAVVRFGPGAEIALAGSWFRPPGPGAPASYFDQRFVCPPDANTADVSLGLATGPWETFIRLNHRGQGDGGQGTSKGEFEASYSAVAGSGENFAVSCLYTKTNEWETRMTYLNREGVMVTIPEASRTLGVANALISFPAAEFAQITEFELQRRRYEWVEFHNVAVRPDVPMVVEVVNATKLPPEPFLLTTPPELRFLAWQDQWETNHPAAAWLPNGLPVTNVTDLNLLRAVAPARCDAAALHLANPPRFLLLWFSHPLFDPETWSEVTLLDEHDQAIRPAAGAMSATGVELPSERNGGLAWVRGALSVGDGTNTPARINVHLRYTVGPLENIQEVPPDNQTMMSLEGGSQVNGVGQDAEGNAFLSIAVNAAGRNNRRFGAHLVTRDGRELASSASASSGNADAGVRVERFEFNARLAEVAHFQVGDRLIWDKQWNAVALPTN